MTGLLTTAVDYVTQHPEQAAALAVGLAGTAGHYLKTGTLPLGRLPYRALRDTLRQLGNQYARTDRPRRVPGLLVTDTTAADLEAALRETAHFESVDLYSYQYDGEVCNLRRPAGSVVDPSGHGTIPVELHVRAFETADGDLWLLAHREASRFEAWGAHIRETVFSWDAGRDQTEQLLADLGIGAERHRNEDRAGVEVVA
jgi:hypothetical protein